MSTTYEPARPRVPYELIPTNVPGAYVSPALPDDLWTIPSVSPSIDPQGTEDGWNSSSWVKSQSPAGGTTVYQGSTVEMHLSDLPRP